MSLFPGYATGQGQCNACCHRHYDDDNLHGEVTGYSDVSMDDSYYKSSDSMSFDEEMLAADDFSSDGEAI